MAPTLSSRTFLLNFWILTICCCFHSQWFVLMSFWWLLNDKHRCRPIEAQSSAFIGFRWNLLNWMALIQRVFSKISWFYCICWFFEVILLKKESYCCLKINWNWKIFHWNFQFFNGFSLDTNTFLAHFFFNLLFLPVFLILYVAVKHWPIS